MVRSPRCAGLLPSPSGGSVGSIVSDLIAETVLAAAGDITPSAFAARVHEHFRAAGLDPDRPWLRPGRAADES